ncbi:MAG: DUF2505 family protein [Bradymonadaceae bacterium]|nr:DUF2505 family protein [Lujinxingiaceae bacterium]
MKLERSVIVKAPPEQVVRYLTSADYIRDLVPHLDGIRSLEEHSRQVVNSATLEQTLRFEAATKLPGFLKKYEGKAPESVVWEERVRWDLERGQGRFEIVPEAPAHWRDRYSNQGQLQVQKHPAGSQLTHVLDFKIQLFGLGKVIEKALASEIELIFEARNDVVRKHFG